MADSQELFDCSICLQLLEDPVTTACGHSFCMKCINTFWDGKKNRRRVYSCPQCRQTFSPRPVLKRNTLLTSLLEEHRRTASQSAAGDNYAESTDVQCDACTGRKRAATMFCLVCLASYCDTHLKPHFEVPPLKKHSLVQASPRIKDHICDRHDKLVEIYCRTDQQFICLLCMMDEHKDHDMVALAAEKHQMQKSLEHTKQDIAERMLSSERKMAELRQAADSIRDAAFDACDDFERLCAEHIRLFIRSVERKRSEMRATVGEAEKAGVDRVNSHLERLQREVLEMRGREDKLNKLSQTEDPVQFFQAYQALYDLPVLVDSNEGLDTLTEFVAEQKDKLKKMCSTGKRALFHHFEENLLSTMLKGHKETPSRTYLLMRYKNSKVKMDPNTVSACLFLSNRNTTISWSDRDQVHPDHPDRFTYYNQALSQKGFTRSLYWEVEWDGGIVELAVSYKGIKRKGSGNDCCFGHNALSWKLVCSSSGCTFWHNNLHKGQIPPTRSHRAGIHLDYKAGTLDFYCVSETDMLTLLHRVQTTFTEPLYPGFSVDSGSTLKICNI